MILPEDRKNHDGEIVFHKDSGFGIFHLPNSVRMFGAPKSEDDIFLTEDEVLYENLEETFDRFAKEVSEWSSRNFNFPVVILKKEIKI